jgi:hypothetical protein
MRVTARLRGWFFALFVCGFIQVLVSDPASAQWTRVVEVPATDGFSVWANDDTIAAGVDSTVYISTDGGTSWQSTTKPTQGVAAITALRVRNHRLYAGTFGQGVFVSDDLGATWQSFNQGLTGGSGNFQLLIEDLAVQGDRLIAATFGEGVYARDLGSGDWAPFGDAFATNQAEDVSSLALGGTRLLAAAGGAGMVFVRDPGDPDWTGSSLDNFGPLTGLRASAATWNGFAWIVGTNLGVFRSPTGEEPWTQSTPVLGLPFKTTFAALGRHLIAAFDLHGLDDMAVVEESDDDGATWGNPETLQDVIVEQMAISRSTLYAVRNDGLWRRSIVVASVNDPANVNPLGLALAGPQPFVDGPRLRFNLAEAGAVSIRVFDVQGRSTGVGIEGWWPSGPQEVSLDARGLHPGVYTAFLTADGRHESVKLIHVR